MGDDKKHRIISWYITATIRCDQCLYCWKKDGEDLISNPDPFEPFHDGEKLHCPQCGNCFEIELAR